MKELQALIDRYGPTEVKNALDKYKNMLHVDNKDGNIESRENN
jgi:hypothetical protein